MLFWIVGCIKYRMEIRYIAKIEVKLVTVERDFRIRICCIFRTTSVVINFYLAYKIFLKAHFIETSVKVVDETQLSGALRRSDRRT